MLLVRLISLFNKPTTPVISYCFFSHSRISKIKFRSLLLYPFQEKRLSGFNNFCRHICLSVVKSDSMDENNVKEVFACNVNDMKDGEMREVEIGETRALLIKDHGNFSAIGHKCTHYGAPLVKGVLKNGHVRCPWHGACFNTTTGDIEDFPGLDCVPKHEVYIKDENKVMIRAMKSDLQSHKRVQKIVESYNENGEHYLIIGGGPTSVTCAETLRQNGFTGKITIASLDSHLPYDRTKLSKAVGADPKSLYLRSQDFYDTANIQILLEKQAIRINTKEHVITFADDDQMSYDKLLIATGGRPRTLPIPGWQLENVCVLRNPNDSSFIAEQAKDKHLVVCGASFIGMELAAALSSIAKSVTVCEFFSVPFERVLGTEIGLFLQRMHEKNNIKFYMNDAMVEIKGSDGRVSSVKLKSGAELQADIVVAGVGVIPSTDWLRDSGISLTKQGFVNVDQHLRVMNLDDNKPFPNIYVGGDIAMYPQMLRNWQPSNIQHWQMAHFHGKVVGSNMAATEGEMKVVNSVPFFWTQQFGKSLRYTGYGMGYDDVITTGSVKDGKFCAYYTIGDDVVAVATMMSDPVAADVASRMLVGEKILKCDVIKSKQSRGTTL